MDIPKELKDLLDMILRDQGGNSPVPLSNLLGNPEGYFSDLVKQGDEKWWDKRRQVVENAQKHDKSHLLLKALNVAANKKKEGELYSLVLLIELEKMFAGGGNKDHAVFLTDLMLLTGCTELNNLLFADFTEITKQDNFHCQLIYNACLKEISKLDENKKEQHIYALVDFCTRSLCTASYDDVTWHANHLVAGIEEIANNEKIKRAANLSKLFEQSVAKHAKGKSDGSKILDRHITVFLDFRYMCEAVNHLVLGDVHFLDPVIADSSCELRPPFILTAYKIVQESLGSLGGLATCKKFIEGFYKNQGVWEERDIKNISQIVGTRPESWDYMRMVRCIVQALRKKKSTYPEYIFLCKVMTRAHYVTRDQFGVEVEDNERTCIYSINTERRKRAALAEYTVSFIKDTAKAVSEDNKFSSCAAITSIGPVFDKCEVHVPQKNAHVKVLPIYSSQKVALFKGCIEKWPLVVRLSRIQYTGNTKYKLLGVATLIYLPKNNFATYELAGCLNVGTEAQEWPIVDAKELMSTPAICVSAFSICSAQGRLGNDDGFRNEDFSAYLNALKECDIVHLLSLSSANHPPFAHEAHAEIDKKSTLLFSSQTEYAAQWDYQWQTLYGQNHTPALTTTDTQLTLQSCYNFLGTSISAEHLDIFKLANKYGLNDRLYLTDNQRLVNEVHFYAIHLYASTLAIEESRAQKIWARCLNQIIGQTLNIEETHAAFDKEANEELEKSREFEST